MPYAEVIGDPVAHSKSPAIHKYWLEQLGIEADYRAVHVRPHELASYFEKRRSEPDWRGCSATIPHKESIAPLVDEMAPAARAIGAANCVVRGDGGLVAHNSDVDGIAAAIGHVRVEGRCVVVIGAGGATRAMLAYLAGRSPGAVTLLVRDPVKTGRLRSTAPGLELRSLPLSEAPDALVSAALVVNASPLGMTGSAPMTDELLTAIEANAIGSTYFDMVYQPLETAFLRAAARGGGDTVDGLTMLIGQARRAFCLFFEQEAPQGDDELRAILTGKSPVPA